MRNLFLVLIVLCLTNCVVTTRFYYCANYAVHPISHRLKFLSNEDDSLQIHVIKIYQDSLFIDSRKFEVLGRKTITSDIVEIELNGGTRLVYGSIENSRFAMYYCNNHITKYSQTKETP